MFKQDARSIEGLYVLNCSKLKKVPTKEINFQKFLLFLCQFNVKCHFVFTEQKKNVHVTLHNSHPPNMYSLLITNITKYVTSKVQWLLYWHIYRHKKNEWTRKKHNNRQFDPLNIIFLLPRMSYIIPIHCSQTTTP